MDIKFKLRPELKLWQAGAIDKRLWSDRAQHASVLISTTADGARAMLIDDQGGIRSVFKVPPGQVPEIIGAAARSWIERGSLASFSVHWDLVAMGSILPPPPPPPGPGGDDPFARAIIRQALAAQAMLTSINELADVGGLREHVQQETVGGR